MLYLSVCVPEQVAGLGWSGGWGSDGAYVVDDGYDTSVKGHRGPDPTRFKNADDCDSWLMVWIYTLVKGACASKWADIDEAFEGANMEGTFWDGQIHDIQLPGVVLGDGGVLRYVGWRAKVEDIGTEDELAAKILVPLRKHLGEILTG